MRHSHRADRAGFTRPVASAFLVSLRSARPSRACGSVSRGSAAASAPICPIWASCFGVGTLFLGPPAIGALLPFLFCGRVPQNRLQKKKEFPYPNLSTGGPSFWMAFKGTPQRALPFCVFCSIKTNPISSLPELLDLKRLGTEAKACWPIHSAREFLVARD